MSPAKLAVVHPFPQIPLAALALAAMFSIGLAAGVSLPRHTADAGAVVAAGTTKPFVGVAFNNMSDAAWAARYDRWRTRRASASSPTHVRASQGG